MFKKKYKYIQFFLFLLQERGSCNLTPDPIQTKTQNPVLAPYGLPVTQLSSTGMFCIPISVNILKLPIYPLLFFFFFFEEIPPPVIVLLQYT